MRFTVDLVPRHRLVAPLDLATYPALRVDAGSILSVVVYLGCAPAGVSKNQRLIDGRRYFCRVANERYDGNPLL
jgi:hypothetical protein